MRTGQGSAFDHAGAQTLARHFEEAKGTDAAELNARSSAADALSGELRSQLSTAQSELAQLRAKLEVEGQSRASSEGRLQASIEMIAEQKRAFADAEKKLKDAFAALSAHALQNNNAEFAKQGRGHGRQGLADARSGVARPLQDGHSQAPLCQRQRSSGPCRAAAKNYHVLDHHGWGGKTRSSSK